MRAAKGVMVRRTLIGWALDDLAEIFVKISLTTSETPELWCEYSLDQLWDGRKAYALIPRPGASKSELASHETRVIVELAVSSRPFLS